jgi:hypothetical protein
MKTRRITPTKLRRLEPARQALRAAAKVCETHDPDVLAGVVTLIDSTLASVVKIDLFFRRYAAALQKRRPQ